MRSGFAKILHEVAGRPILDHVLRAAAPLKPARTVVLVGVNDRAQLAQAEHVLRERVRRNWLQAGVTMLHPPTTFIDDTVKIGADVVLEQGVCLRGSTSVGDGARIGANSVLTDYAVAAHEQVTPLSKLG